MVIWDHSLSTYAKLTLACAYQGVRNISFSDNFAHILNDPLWLLAVKICLKFEKSKEVYDRFLPKNHVHHAIVHEDCKNSKHEREMVEIEWDEIIFAGCVPVGAFWDRHISNLLRDTIIVTTQLLS